MQVVKISFKTDKGKYELYAHSEQLRSLLTDNLFAGTFVDAKNGKVINHGEEIEKIIDIKVEEAPHEE